MFDGSGRLLHCVADMNAERHERCRNHRQARSTLFETARLGRLLYFSWILDVSADTLHSTSSRLVLLPAMASMKDWNG